MKIILEHIELVTLQGVAKGIFAKTRLSSRTIGQVNTFSELFEAGLINAHGHLYRQSGDYTEIFGPITITPLGKKTLAANLPWIDPINKAGAVFGHGKQTGLIRMGLPK